MDNDANFDDWYRRVSSKLGINPNPDDPDHYYDYRAFHRDMLAGKVISPDRPGGHFPSDYKLPGHPRTYLSDGKGRVFDTRSGQYITGEDVPRSGLRASEDQPDMPGFDDTKAQQLLGLSRIIPILRGK